MVGKKLIFNHKILLFSFLFSYFLSESLWAQSFLWTRETRGSVSSKPLSGGLAVDDNGNVFVAGNFAGTLTLGNVTLQSRGDRDNFLVKYDNDGNVIWGEVSGGAMLDYPRSIASDGSGNVVMAGIFHSPSITFGNITLNNWGTFNSLFVVKYDASGNVLWAKVNSNYPTITQKVQVDLQGNIFVAGYVTVPGAFHAFVIKYSSQGDVLRSVYSQGGYVACNSMALDTNGNVFLSGGFIDKVVFGNYSIVNTSLNPASSDGFVVKLDADFNPVWLSQITGNHSERAYDMVTDLEGNIYVTGSFDKIANFGSIQLEVNPTRVPEATDIFIVKYNTQGNAIWGRTSGTIPGGGNGFGIAVSQENIYVTGFASQYMFKNGESVRSCGHDDVMIVCYDQAGNIQALAKAGGSLFDVARYIQLDGEGNCFAAGDFFSPYMDAGPDRVTNSSESNVFVMKLGKPPWRYAGLSISSVGNIDCSTAFPVSVTQGCMSFPSSSSTDQTDISIEISEVNSEIFSGTPPVIGTGIYRPINCKLPVDAVRGVYAIRAVQNGEVGSNTINVTVECKQPEPPESPEPEVFIPNVFTPNNDADNNIFTIEYDGTESVKMEVYNRWGSLVYFTADIKRGWDGDGFPSGIYLYRIHIGRREYKGPVHLIR